MTIENAPAPVVDVTNCDREPIHVPGSIQPHGVLIAFREPSREIVSVSANSATLLGRTPESLVGQPLAEVLDAADVDRLVARGALDGQVGLDALVVKTATRDGARAWTALLHRHDGLAVVELEPVDPPRDGTSALLRVGTAAQRLQGAQDVVDACAIVAESVRAITGFGRVKVYRFAADWSGEVLAEARSDEMPSYLGLHFPASDIPSQARALYASNPVRLIADVHYVPAPLVPDRHPVTGDPIDLRFATLRSVSPIHVEYLRNMRVGASMSASIVRGGTLWGLIACHHATPLLVDFERRQACALVAQLLAARLDAQERVERARRSVHVEALRNTMLRALADGLSVTEAIDQERDEWMRLVGASGFTLTRTDEPIRAGLVPPASFLRRLAPWLDTDPTRDHVATDRLGALFPPAAAHAATASGVLAIALSRTEGSHLLWFRPELLQQVTWAGRPDKNAGPAHGDTTATLHPRQSFDAWSEEVRGRARPWTEQEIATALQLRELLLDLVVREKDVLERQNTRLAIGSRELETFIYVASHDIKEPLRQMEMLVSLLREHVANGDSDEVVDYFREFRTVAQRLRVLTDALADYAKLGRGEPGLVPLALDDLLDEVLADLDTRIAQAGATVRVEPLPTVLGERAQLHQVFVNLIGNALKYRADDRALVVTVGASHASLESDDGIGAARPMTRVVITDNGIGFDPRFDERVFEAFWRAHSRDRYEGTGIGLAICRRIVERHHGRIEAHGIAGVGATFSLTLPLASSPGSPGRSST